MHDNQKAQLYRFGLFDYFQAPQTGHNSKHLLEQLKILNELKVT